jgi:hypothetical protein
MESDANSADIVTGRCRNFSGTARTMHKITALVENFKGN